MASSRPKRGRTMRQTASRASVFATTSSKKRQPFQYGVGVVSLTTRDFEMILPALGIEDAGFIPSLASPLLDVHSMRLGRWSVLWSSECLGFVPNETAWWRCPCVRLINHTALPSPVASACIRQRAHSNKLLSQTTEEVVGKEPLPLALACGKTPTLSSHRLSDFGRAGPLVRRSERAAARSGAGSPHSVSWRAYMRGRTGFLRSQADL